jgi:hypothetical protein
VTLSRAGSRSQSEPSTESLAEALTALCAEVGIPFEEMLHTVEGALAVAYARAFSPAGDITVKLDTKTGGLEVRSRIGYLPETVPLYTDLTPYDYLDYMAKLKGLRDGKARKERIWTVMQQVRIDDVAGKPIGRLSKGYRQRVGLAQALIHGRVPVVAMLVGPGYLELVHEIAALPSGSRVGLVCASERGAENMAETLAISGTTGVELLSATLDGDGDLELIDRTADVILLSREAIATGTGARFGRPERLRQWSYEFDPSGLELLRRSIEHVMAARRSEAVALAT